MGTRDAITCPHPMYGKLAALCARAGYWLELAEVGSGMELRVVGKQKPNKSAPLATPFEAGRPDLAARILLDALK